MKRLVGLLLVVKTGDECRVVLRRRGLWNWKMDAPEFWGNSYQITCRGGCKKDEDSLDALARKLEEELGFCRLTIRFELVGKVREVGISKTKEGEVRTFFLVIPFDWIARLPASDCLIPISREQAVNIKTLQEPFSDGTIPMETSVFPEGEIRMWPDEKETVLKVFELLSAG